jgi:hypothetical protein
MRTANPFQITRPDGRSNSQVVIDHVRDGEPGRVYTYDELGAALAEGTDHIYSVDAVRAAVTASCARLLKEHQRALHNVRLVGYRLAYAKDHMGLALIRKRRADVQIKRGLQTLRHVRWDEMDENTRRAHEGHLMITESLVANQMHIEKRLQAVEQAIVAGRK